MNIYVCTHICCLYVLQQGRIAILKKSLNQLINQSTDWNPQSIKFYMVTITNDHCYCLSFQGLLAKWLDKDNIIGKAVGTGQASQAMAWPVLAAQFLKNSYKESEKC